MQRTPIAKIKLSNEEKKKMLDKIATFYLDAFDEEIGIVKQQEILECFMDELAVLIYNKALDDARKWYGRQHENMDNDFYVLYLDE